MAQRIRITQVEKTRRIESKQSKNQIAQGDKTIANKVIAEVIDLRDTKCDKVEYSKRKKYSDKCNK